jgi:hypothetical protein
MFIVFQIWGLLKLTEVCNFIIMKIACLGWGSLIWRPENLQVQEKWFEDGPILPIEFSRQSDNGRITLIIDEKAKPVRVLWALMTTENLELSIESLKEREFIM